MPESFKPKKSGPPLPEFIPQDPLPAKGGYHPADKPFGSGGADPSDSEVQRRKAGVASRAGTKVPFM